MSITHCPTCGNKLTPAQIREKTQQVYLVKHVHNHVEHIDECFAWSDAFFEIKSGSRKGNLVHRWNAKGISKR